MEYLISLLTMMGISILGALSLNIIVGFCGQISLGHAAFLGVGAYTSALLTKSGVLFGVALPAGMLVASLLGVLVGFASLRVQHDFLATTTMGVGFLFLGIVRKQDVLGGEMGITMIPDPGVGKLSDIWCWCCCWRISLWGVIIAAAVLSVFPMWFQFIDQYKLLVYGGLLCAIMIFSPDGLSGIFTRTYSSVKGKKSNASG